MTKLTRKQVDQMLRSGIELNATARLILLGYASHMSYTDKVEEVYPALDTVAEFAGVSTATVHKYVKALVADGFMHRTDYKWINNKRRDYYVLLRGEIESDVLRRRPPNKGMGNLTPGNPKKKNRDKSIGTTEEVEDDFIGTTDSEIIGTTEDQIIGTTDSEIIGGTEANNHSNIHSNNQENNHRADATSRDAFVKKIAGPSLPPEERSEAEDKSGEPSSLPSGEAANEDAPPNSSNDDESSFASESGDSPTPREPDYRSDRKSSRMGSKKRCHCGFPLDANDVCYMCKNKK